MFKCPGLGGGFSQNNTHVLIFGLHEIYESVRIHSDSKEFVHFLWYVNLAVI